MGRAGWNRGPYAVARSGHLALHRSWLLFASALAVSLLGFPPDKDECKSEISLVMIMRGAVLWARKPSLKRAQRETNRSAVDLPLSAPYGARRPQTGCNEALLVTYSNVSLRVWRYFCRCPLRPGAT